MNWVVRMISAIRAVRSEMNVPPGAEIACRLKDASDVTRRRVATHMALIRRLARLSSVEVLDAEAAGQAVARGAAQVVVDEATAILPLAGVIDLDQERARLAKEAGRLDGEIVKIRKKLENERDRKRVV